MLKADSALRNPIVLLWWGFLAAFFIANGLFIYLAQVTNPGLVNEDYYEKGRAYEQHMLSQRAQVPDWELKLASVGPFHLKQPGQLELQLNSGTHEVFNAESVRLHAYRPSGAEHDFSVPLKSLGAGVYRTSVTFPLPGVWDLLMEVKRGEAHKTLARRIQVAD